MGVALSVYGAGKKHRQKRHGLLLGWRSVVWEALISSLLIGRSIAKAHGSSCSLAVPYFITKALPPTAIGGVLLM
jgi:hypothetical protein